MKENSFYYEVKVFPKSLSMPKNQKLIAIVHACILL